MIELYSIGFCCQGVQTRNKQRIQFAETFGCACQADSFFTRQTDFYLSLYTFDSGLLEHFQQTGNSIAGFKGGCFCPYLWFDIDRGDLVQALDDVRRLVLFFYDSKRADQKQIVTDSENLLIFFSGSKGFHVGVPIEVFGDGVKAGLDFPKQYKAVALEISKLSGVEIDKAVFDRQRLFRCPNTKHGKTGLYKIPLSYSELFSESIEEIKQRAKTPRRLINALIVDSAERDSESENDVCFVPVNDAVPEAVEIWNRVSDESLPVGASVLGGVAEQDTEKPVSGQRQFSCCVNRLPDGVEVPRLRRDTMDFIQHGAKRGERAVRLFNSVCDCVRCGWNRQAVESIFYDIGNKIGLYWKEVQEQIEKGLNYKNGLNYESEVQ